MRDRSYESLLALLCQMTFQEPFWAVSWLSPLSDQPTPRRQNVIVGLALRRAKKPSDRAELV